MTNLNTKEYWEEQFQKELNFEYCRWCFERFEYISVYLDNAKGSNVLDVGCGLGNFCRYIKAKHFPMDVHGVEFSEKVIEEARKISDPRINFHYWDGKRLPFKDGTFLNVVSGEVIEHLDEDKIVPFVDELIRVTKKGGRIILTTPYRGLLDGDPGKDGAKISGEHVKEYTPNELNEMLKSRVKGKMRLSLPPIKIEMHTNKEIKSHYFVVMFHPHQDLPLISRTIYYG